MIRLDKVSKTYDGGLSYAVNQVSFEVPDGETLVLLGSSGCGKTTTLKMINRLVEPSAGAIEVDGSNIMERDPVELRRSIGYVFQGIGLFPHMTVEENITVGLRLAGSTKEERRRRAQELLELINLEPAMAKRYPAELSGGQQQRLGVARALATESKYLLMDEPFGALDALTRDTLQQELLKLKQKLEKTIVFVTHDIFEALTLADRIAVMHQGRLEQLGTGREILSNPATAFVKELFGKPAAQLQAFQGQLHG